MFALEGREELLTRVTDCAANFVGIDLKYGLQAMWFVHAHACLLH